MRAFRSAAALALAAAIPVLAQGFDSFGSTPTSTSSSSSSSSDDRKFSLFASIGAGFSLGGIQPVTLRTDGSSDKTVDGTLRETEDEYANFGRGMKIDLGASYAIMEYVRLLAAFNMSFGIPYTETIDETTVTAINTTTTETFTLHHTQLGLKLLLVPHFRAFNLLDIYIGAGLGLYWTAASYEYTEEVTGTGARTDDEEADIDCKASLPFIGMIGVEYPITDRLVIYLDLVFEAMNVTLQEIKVETSDWQPPPTTIQFEKDDVNDFAPVKVPASNLAVRLGVRIPLF